MAVDFTKQAHILAVHGVQTGSDDDITADSKIEKLTTAALNRSHITRDFQSLGFLYEDINDDAQTFYNLLARAITRGNPLAGKALRTFVDLAGDVVTASANTSTAKKIRRKLSTLNEFVGYKWTPVGGGWGEDFVFVGNSQPLQSWAKGTTEYDSSAEGQAADERFFKHSTCTNQMWNGYWIVVPEQF